MALSYSAEFPDPRDASHPNPVLQAPASFGPERNGAFQSFAELGQEGKARLMRVGVSPCLFPEPHVTWRKNQATPGPSLPGHILLSNLLSATLSHWPPCFAGSIKPFLTPSPQLNFQAAPS